MFACFVYLEKGPCAPGHDRLVLWAPLGKSLAAFGGSWGDESIETLVFFLCESSFRFSNHDLCLAVLNIVNVPQCPLIIDVRWGSSAFGQPESPKWSMQTSVYTVLDFFLQRLQQGNTMKGNAFNFRGNAVYFGTCVLLSGFQQMVLQRTISSWFVILTH
jgi:hypothetical protein